ncbi:uncharacterized protein LOC116677135 isoform X2 [Etheostoma spectabile]|uniref:uncharacterized protein LOC116677135 isoform X2 n=1 Tax=Etheostoma spectabile TaxID=54343 RepID=UPI0013AF5ECA|nr:uncharacterized protein LOC116677135 isoform X2 [Etheostoma spectabile]
MARNSYRDNYYQCHNRDEGSDSYPGWRESTPTPERNQRLRLETEGVARHSKSGINNRDSSAGQNNVGYQGKKGAFCDRSQFQANRPRFQPDRLSLKTGECQARQNSDKRAPRDRAPPYGAQVNFRKREGCITPSEGQPKSCWTSDTYADDLTWSPNSYQSQSRGGGYCSRTTRRGRSQGTRGDHSQGTRGRHSRGTRACHSQGTRGGHSKGTRGGRSQRPRCGRSQRARGSPGGNNESPVCDLTRRGHEPFTRDSVNRKRKNVDKARQEAKRSRYDKPNETRRGSAADRTGDTSIDMSRKQSRSPYKNASRMKQPDDNPSDGELLGTPGVSKLPREAKLASEEPTRDEPESRSGPVSTDEEGLARGTEVASVVHVVRDRKKQKSLCVNKLKLPKDKPEGQSGCEQSQVTSRKKVKSAGAMSKGKRKPINRKHVSVAKTSGGLKRRKDYNNAGPHKPESHTPIKRGAKRSAEDHTENRSVDMSNQQCKSRPVPDKPRSRALQLENSSSDNDCFVVDDDSNAAPRKPGSHSPIKGTVEGSAENHTENTSATGNLVSRRTWSRLNNNIDSYDDESDSPRPGRATSSDRDDRRSTERSRESQESPDGKNTTLDVPDTRSIHVSTDGVGNAPHTEVVSSDKQESVDSEEQNDQSDAPPSAKRTQGSQELPDGKNTTLDVPNTRSMYVSTDGVGNAPQAEVVSSDKQESVDSEEQNDQSDAPPSAKRTQGSQELPDGKNTTLDVPDTRSIHVSTDGVGNAPHTEVVSSDKQESVDSEEQNDQSDAPPSAKRTQGSQELPDGKNTTLDVPNTRSMMVVTDAEEEVLEGEKQDVLVSNQLQERDRHQPSSDPAQNYPHCNTSTAEIIHTHLHATDQGTVVCQQEQLHHLQGQQGPHLQEPKTPVVLQAQEWHQQQYSQGLQQQQYSQELQQQQYSQELQQQQYSQWQQKPYPQDLQTPVVLQPQGLQQQQYSQGQQQQQYSQWQQKPYPQDPQTPMVLQPQGEQQQQQGSTSNPGFIDTHKMLEGLNPVIHRQESLYHLQSHAPQGFCLPQLMPITTPAQCEPDISYQEPSPNLSQEHGDGGTEDFDMLLIAVKQSVLCSTCKTMFNRAIVCDGYLIELNRAIQCECHCVTCTLCYRKGKPCRLCRLKPKNGLVSTIANTLTSCPVLDKIGDWDLGLDDTDPFKTENEINECVRQILTQDQPPSAEDLDRAFETLIQDGNDTMTFKYWPNKPMPLHVANKYVCIPHVPGFWDHVIVATHAPHTMEDLIGPDVFLPKLFGVELGCYRFHWCCLVLKKQMVLSVWCTDEPGNGQPRVIPIVENDLRSYTDSPKFTDMVFYLREWFTAQYTSPSRELNMVLDCKPSQGSTFVHFIAYLASKIGMRCVTPNVSQVKTKHDMNYHLNLKAADHIFAEPSVSGYCLNIVDEFAHRNNTKAVSVSVQCVYTCTEKYSVM